MPTFETPPRFERDWKNLTRQQQAIFRKVITEYFVPDLAAPDRPFRPGLRVKGVTAHPGVFEMTWGNDGRATFTCGDEQIPGQAHVSWRRTGTPAIFTRPPGPWHPSAQPRSLINWEESGRSPSRQACPAYQRMRRAR